MIKICVAPLFVLAKNWKTTQTPISFRFLLRHSLIKPLAQESASLTTPISESITVLGDAGLGLCPLLKLGRGVISSRTMKVRSLSCCSPGRGQWVGSTVVCH